jgi:DNA primase
MDIQTAKQIKIADFLHSLGYSPVKQQGINLWYKSPLREETEASFKVNTERNQWYDFALSKGGNIIALAQELYCSDYVPYLLQKIGEQTPHIRPVSFSFGKQSFSELSFQQLDIVQLASPVLLFYLQERGINTALAKRECKEAHFIHNDKRYFAIAFPNMSGGYEIRNR